MTDTLSFPFVIQPELEVSSQSLVRFHGPKSVDTIAFQEQLDQLAKTTEGLTLVSRVVQSAIVLKEIEEDESDFVEGGVDIGTTLREWLSATGYGPRAHAIAERLGIGDRLSLGVRFLSTGELRKAMLARALAGGSRLLVGGDLLEGLDVQARALVSQLLEEPQNALDACVLWGIESGCTPEDPRLREIAASREWSFQSLRAVEASAEDRAANLGDLTGLLDAREEQAQTQRQPLVRMVDVNVGWDEQPVLKAFHWELYPGEHSFISGPNGCGKSSLLRLITGENPQVFSNHVEIFGMRRGSGETIWDIKRQLGVVSHKFHMDYLHHADYSCLEVVVSGFYDSIGMYEEPTSREILAAKRWLTVLELDHLAERPFTSLDWGRQRMLLVARALVKEPKLLILDEPCQGLSPADRATFLRLLEAVAAHEASTILHVSHDPSEQLAFHRFLLRTTGRAMPWTKSKVE